MKHLLLISLTAFFFANVTTAQEEQSAEEFQKELNAQYHDPKESPLKEGAKTFKGHQFFEIDSTFAVKAKFTRTVGAIPFQMKTSTSRLPIYEKYGEVTFVLEGESFTLSIYQNHNLREKEAFKEHLFLPYTDLTNGEETYSGGRYIDLKIPKGDMMLIDFNKSYNPYCAYTEGYSCPIPPAENNLNYRIRAGVKKPKKAH
ncbi:DUF1684 domain-containing protein [Spongiimicrobium salis]|uniref:DUF1684 domain-containing protein n=1 Tax=Spongiimicrobium salis TaxID=1667022 RepID=UPI00374CCD33